MYDFMVDRHTECRGEDLRANLIAFKGRYGAGISDALLRSAIEIEGGHSRFNRIQNLFMHIGYHLTCQAHQLDFCSGLSYDHNDICSVARPPMASKVLAPNPDHRHGGAVSFMSPRTRLRMHYVILFLFIGAAGNFLPIWFRHKGWTDIEIGWQGAINYTACASSPSPGDTSLIDGDVQRRFSVYCHCVALLPFCPSCSRVTWDGFWLAPWVSLPSVRVCLQRPMA